MDKQKHMSISEFSYVSGISRKNLIFYHDIGLLIPDYIAPNKYRYYTFYQLDLASVIIALKEIGMPLKEIKEYMDSRTPEKLVKLLKEQKFLIEEHITKLNNICAMIQSRMDLTSMAMEVRNYDIHIKECEAEWIYASDEINHETQDAELKSMVDFYDQCAMDQVAYGYPLATITYNKSLLNKNYEKYSRIFVRPALGFDKNKLIEKPKGLYAIGYGASGYEQDHELYKKLYAFIEKCNLTITGDSYEELLLDEIAVKDPNGYLHQIAIGVGPRK